MGLEFLGVRWAMVVAQVFAGVIFTVYFVTGRWKRKEV